MTRHAVPFASAMFLGYSGGIALAVLRLQKVESLRKAVTDGVPGADQLHPLLRNFRSSAEWLSVYRFPNHVVLDPGNWIRTAVFILVISFAAFLLARRAPLTLAPGELTNAPTTTLPSITAHWRRALARASGFFATLPGLLLAFVLGCAGAVLAEVYNVARCHLGSISLRPTFPQPRAPFAGSSHRKTACGSCSARSGLRCSLSAPPVGGCDAMRSFTANGA